MDATGVEVTATDIGRIVSVNRDITGMLFAQGPGDQVVADGISALYPLEAVALPKIGYARDLKPRASCPSIPRSLSVTTEPVRQACSIRYGPPKNQRLSSAPTLCHSMAWSTRSSRSVPRSESLRSENARNGSRIPARKHRSARRNTCVTPTSRLPRHSGSGHPDDCRDEHTCGSRDQGARWHQSRMRGPTTVDG